METSKHITQKSSPRILLVSAGVILVILLAGVSIRSAFTQVDALIGQNSWLVDTLLAFLKVLLNLLINSLGFSPTQTASLPLTWVSLLLPVPLLFAHRPLGHLAWQKHQL